MRDAIVIGRSSPEWMEGWTFRACEGILDYVEDWCRWNPANRCIPVIVGTPRRLRDRSAEHEVISRLDAEAHALRLSEAVSAASWMRPLGGAPLAVASDMGPSRVFAAIVAALSDSDPIVAERLSDVLSNQGTLRLLLVSLLGTITDDSVAAVLERTRRAASTRNPLKEIPRICLLTADGSASLSWQVAKLVMWRASQSTRKPASLTQIIVHKNTPAIRALAVHAAFGGSIWRSAPALDVQALKTEVQKPLSVLGYQTHGEDACARGGSELVLCGLRAAGVYRAGHELACGQGFPCPRGPQPLPLEALSTDVLMLSACQTLRLGGSLLNGRFSLVGSFLDGSGLTFVSSVASTLATEVSTRVFLAALASGHAADEATLFSNMALLTANLDTNTFMAVGVPDYSTTNRAPSCTSLIGSLPAGVELDCGESWFVELTSADRDMLILAESGDLYLDVQSSTPGTGISWWIRIEESAGSSGLLGRVFLARFPEPLGNVTLRIGSTESLLARHTSMLRSLEFWHEMVGRLGVEDGSSKRSTIDSGLAVIRQVLATERVRLRFDGATPSRLWKASTVAASCVELARSLALQSCSERLPHPFWLMDIFDRDHPFVRSESGCCIYCSGVTIRRWHALMDANGPTRARIVDECLHCGPLWEHAADDGIDFIQIDCLGEARCGDSIDVAISIRSAEEQRFLVALALTTWSESRAVCEPTISEARESSGLCRFTITIPLDYPPHAYRLKAVVAGRQSISISARPLTVRRAREETEVAVGPR